ncbi:MAG: phosphatase PAP2 family protein [Minisyncoccia bacterium]|jgi:undecaprenyl-diphosphatase
MPSGREDARAFWLFVFAALCLLLAFITREVMTSHNFLLTADSWVENMLLGIRTPSLLRLFNGITLLGDTAVVVAITGIIGIFLLFFKNLKAYVAGLAIAVIGAGGMGYVMKIIVGRMRPGGLIPSAIDTSPSFPSGHTTVAIALYGFLACLLCKLYPKHAAIIVTLATVIILAVGFSRLYLGLHFPSDVLAGYLLGGLWLIIGIKTTTLLKKNSPGASLPPGLG